MNKIVEFYDDYSDRRPTRVTVRETGRIAGNKALVRHSREHNIACLPPDILSAALVWLANMLEEVVVRDGCAITIDDVGTFKPVLRTQDGVRVTIQFRPKPQLVHRLEDTRQYVERHVKTSDGTYTKYDGRIVEHYRWKKEYVRCKKADG